MCLGGDTFSPPNRRTSMSMLSPSSGTNFGPEIVTPNSSKGGSVFRVPLRRSGTTAAMWPTVSTLRGSKKSDPEVGLVKPDVVLPRIEQSSQTITGPRLGPLIKSDACARSCIKKSQLAIPISFLTLDLPRFGRHLGQFVSACYSRCCSNTQGLK